MYLSGNQANNCMDSGERRSSYQHYSMSQVNNEKPIVQREHEEQSQSWGQPLLSSSASFYPNNPDSNRNFSFDNRLGSSSSSLFDRNNSILNDNMTSANAGSSSITKSNTYAQQANVSSSYSKAGTITRQIQSGTQHFHDVPYFHGFQFQTLPGLSLFSIVRQNRIYFIFY